MQVEMTQFIRPNGARRPTSCEVPDELADKVKAIRDAGLRFTAEVIGPNVCFCIKNDEEDLACEIVGNGSLVIPTVTKMIRNFEIPDSKGEEVK